MSTSMTLSPGSYPTLQAERIAEPNRLWAFLVLGAVVKGLLLIPVFVWLSILELVVLILIVLNSVVVLFTGSFWQPAYDFTVGYMRLTAKLSFYLAGLTDKYPGFGFEIDDRYALDIQLPEQPNRAFAIPFLGGLFRGILLIPFAIYAYVVLYATYLGVVVSSFPVLFSGKYPESIFELVRDAVRIQTAEIAYVAGLSDSYPSFAISMNHGTIKGVLFVIGALMMVVYVVVASGNR